jgi:hypothetical protein
VCAFSLGATLSGSPVVLEALPLLGFPEAFTGISSWITGAAAFKRGEDGVTSGTDTTWQACADRKDTDGKHRFTIATGAAFGLAERSLAVSQTWFCHDDADRL